MKKSEEENFEEEIFGESYYFIAGYTSGGAPYGTTMQEAEEQGLLNEEDESQTVEAQRWLEENDLSSDKDLDLPF